MYFFVVVVFFKNCMTVQITLLEFTTTRYIAAANGYIQYFKCQAQADTT